MIHITYTGPKIQACRDNEHWIYIFGEEVI